MKNGFPFSLPTLLLIDFPLLHLSQKIVMMIPFDPQLDHPRMMMMMMILYSLDVQQLLQARRTLVMKQPAYLKTVIQVLPPQGDYELKLLALAYIKE